MNKLIPFIAFFLFALQAKSDNWMGASAQKRNQKLHDTTTISNLINKAKIQEKERDKGIEVLKNTDYENKLVTKDWYALNHFHGTSEEQSLVQFLIDTIENFKEKYENVYILRNEQVYKIYDFKDGKGFEPDFLLFLKEKEADRYYQEFIEPKGSQFKDATGKFDNSKEAWKQQFLTEITNKYGKEDVLKVENKDYRLVGLPLYNATIAHLAKQSIYENLEVEL